LDLGFGIWDLGFGIAVDSIRDPNFIFEATPQSTPSITNPKSKI
jgi:hypothetical protein